MHASAKLYGPLSSDLKYLMLVGIIIFVTIYHKVQIVAAKYLNKKKTTVRDLHHCFLH